jgi:hypothetical protein
MWFTEPSADMIGVFQTPSGKVIATHPLPANSRPVNITATAAGVFFTEEVSNQIGMLTVGGQYSHWTVPTFNSEPWGITVGPDGNIWFTELNGNNIGRLDPASGRIAEFPIGVAGGLPTGITSGPDGNIWFTDNSNKASAIGRLNLDKPLTGTGMTLSAGEAGTFAGTVATFTDADPLATPSSFTATIDWGTKFKSAGTIVLDQNGKQFDVIGNSTAYPEEGNYSVTVTVTDIDDSHDIGGSTVTINSTMQVADAGLLPIGLYFVANEGQAFSNVNVAHFVDGGPEGLGSYTATINWGDATLTSTGTVSWANGLLQVNGGHTYAEEGGYTLQVQLNDEGGSVATAVSTVSVNDESLSVSAVSFSGTERSAVTGVTVASFTDLGGPEPPANYTTTINWGDQTPTVTGTVVNNNGVLDVVGSHTYADEGKYTVTVSVLDAGGQPYYVFGTATIADAALTGKATTVTTKEGSFFSGTVASFTDAAGLEATNDYSVLVNWGDSHKSAGLLVANANGGYDVVGDHLYSEEGNYTITVSIVDDGGSTATVSSTAKVTDAALSAMGLSFTGTKGVALNNVLVAIFDDAGGPEPPGNYTVSINWGDNSLLTSGSLTPLGTLFEADGSHTYHSAGSFTVTITIKDLGGASVMVTGKATIT